MQRPFHRLDNKAKYGWKRYDLNVLLNQVRFALISLLLYRYFVPQCFSFYLRRSRQVKACSILFFFLLLLEGPFWRTHVLSKEVCSERSFTLPMCFQKRCVQRGVFKEVYSERCVQRGVLNLNSPPNLLLQGNTSQQKNISP